MLRRAAPLLTLAVLAGCQNYNFNPVGKCVIQPGTTQFKLSAVNTADILFVVDDSGSMASNQKNLADNFGTFIAELAKTQKDRTARGLQALDFHIAITTSAVYENFPAAGNAACASTTQGPQCQFTSYASTFQSYACTTLGQGCGDLITSYFGFGPGGTHPSCTPGVGVEGQQYPSGNFVSAGGNPKVLHFTKDLGWATWGTNNVDPKLDTLVKQFQANIAVGTCGSGQEQHLQGARLAIQKALRQNGLAQPADVAVSEFPHPGAKLVVVVVGDEDDCSGPKDPMKGVQTDASTFDTADACVQDWRQPNQATRKEFPTTDFADFLTGLGRPVGAAFISSSNCTVDATGKKTCQPGLCGCTTPAGQTTDPATCHGKSSGTRMKEVASALEGRGVGVVESSICDASFATTLASIAQLVKPPAGLQLPSQPAANEVAVLRIVNASGNTARICKGPAADADWWFVDCNDTTGAAKTTPTSCIALRAGSACEPNPGESYSAEYLGVVPAPTASSPLGGCASPSKQSSECSQLLGGRAQDWACEIPSGVARGTCLCNASP